MPTVALSDEQWQKMLPFLRSHPNAYVWQEQDCRKFLEAVLWIPRSGAQGRLPPAEYGDWDTVYKRFSRWSRQGVFEQLHQSFAGDADMEHLLIDSTIIRTQMREYDRHLYRERHSIECFIGKIKQYRRVSSRFEKLAKNHLGFLSFVSALIWLR